VVSLLILWAVESGCGKVRVMTDLQVGLSLEQVRLLLPGWKDVPRQMVKPQDSPNLYHTWDFIPPLDSGLSPIRMTFDNDKLVVWGEAAEGGGTYPHNAAAG
jgi:hypothetical protein